MTVILRDAMIFLKNSDAEPIIGALSYKTPFTPNTIITINTGSKTITVLAKQIKLGIFKINSHEFRFIFKSVSYSNKKEDFNYWNKETAKMAGRELKPCFADEKVSIKEG